MTDEKALALKHVDAEIAKELCFAEKNKTRIVALTLPGRVMTLEEVRREIELGTMEGARQIYHWKQTPEDLEKWRDEARIRLSKARL